MKRIEGTQHILKTGINGKRGRNRYLNKLTLCLFQHMLYAAYGYKAILKYCGRERK